MKFSMVWVCADSFVYLPTQCRMVLDLICQARPHHHLIIGDFDELPDVQVPGKNAPLVASKVTSLPLADDAAPDPIQTILLANLQLTRPGGNHQLHD